MKRLEKALSEVIQFLEQDTAETHWLNTLKDIQRRLQKEPKNKRTPDDLEKLFAGMGSLNDIYFCEENENLPGGKSREHFNAQWSERLDNLFKELRLVGAHIFSRIEWEWLAWKHRNEPPPRIKKTFRQRGNK